MKLLPVTRFPMVGAWFLLSLTNTSLSQPTFDHLPVYAEGHRVMVKHVRDRLVYPEQARLDNLTGTALISLRINKEGEVDGIEVGELGPIIFGPLEFRVPKTQYPNPRPVAERSDLVFDLVVIDAVEGLGNFQPATIGGEPITCWVTFQVNFMMNDSGQHPMPKRGLSGVDKN
ncbi:MAG: hypothetical protein AAGA85_05100 [Bacteroidota bacterium]